MLLYGRRERISNDASRRRRVQLALPHWAPFKLAEKQDRSMTEQLRGLSILVVEDEYFIAMQNRRRDQVLRRLSR